MARFLFAAFTEDGFFLPALGIAQSLASRGHIVEMIAEPGRRPLMETYGVSSFDTPEADSICCRVGTWGDQRSIACHASLFRQAISKFRPDVLVASALTLSALIVREETGIPTALLGFASYMFPRVESEGHTPPDLIERLRWWRYSETLRILETARANAGLPPSADIWKSTKLLGDLFLLRSVPALQNGGAGLPKNVRLVGACLLGGEAGDSPVSAWIEARRKSDQPIVYAQIGRSFKGSSLWSILIDALAEEDVAVVANIARCDALIDSVPSNFITTSIAGQTAVLNASRVIICDGHSTAVLGALSAGVPSILSPNGSGTEEVAYMCDRAAVGEVFPRDCVSASAIHTEVFRRLDDSAVLSACSAIRGSFAPYREFEVAASELESLLHADRHALEH